MHSYKLKFEFWGDDRFVLILVLMEDALVLKSESGLLEYHISLNPCFNGRCTRTIPLSNNSTLGVGLNPCFNGRCTRTYYTSLHYWNNIVLILVLMEDALVQQIENLSSDEVVS